MTTNTTRLAEAIGIISSVLSDEIAQSNHFLEEEETVAASDYEEIKEVITDGVPDIMTDIEALKNVVEAAIDLDGPDDDNDDDDEDDEDDAEEAGDTSAAKPLAYYPTNPPMPPAIDADSTSSTIINLQESNERLLDTLDTIFEQLNDLATSVEGLQEEVEEHNG